MLPSKLYEKAQKRVEEKKGFYQHLSIYLFANFIFLAVDVFFSPGRFWFFYPAMGWAIGLLAHYISIFGFPWIALFDEEWETKEINKEIVKLQKRENKKGAVLMRNNIETLDLTGKMVRKKVKIERQNKN